MNTNPGPGEYTPSNKNKNNAPAFKFGETKKVSFFNENIKEKNSQPGPGDYKDINNPKHLSSKFTFTKEKKFLDFRPDTPGPGSYTEKKLIGELGPKISFSKNSDDRLITDFSATVKLSAEFAPGPGFYNTLTQSFNNKSSKKFLIGGLKKDINYETKVPGPGSYNTLISSKFKDPSYRYF